MRLALFLAIMGSPLLWGVSTDGTMWGGTIQRSGDYATAGIVTSPTVLWQRAFSAPITTTTAASTTMVFVATNDGKFYALDRTNGNTVWETQLIPPTYGSPAVAEASDRVFISDGRGLHAFVASTGAPDWDTLADGPVLSSAGGDAGSIYIGTNQGRVRAVAEIGGVTMWETDLETPVTASIAISPLGSRVYSADHRGNIFALDLATGAVVWRVPTGSVSVIAQEAPIDATPAIDPVEAVGLVAVSGRGDLMLLDPTNGDEVWRVSSESLYGASPTIAHGNIYACLALSSISALDPADGSERWRFIADSNLSARSVASTDIGTDTVYISSVLGTVYALDPTDGSERWRFSASGGFFSDVAVNGGNIFAGTVGGVLYALEP